MEITRLVASLLSIMAVVMFLSIIGYLLSYIIRDKTSEKETEAWFRNFGIKETTGELTVVLSHRKVDDAKANGTLPFRSRRRPKGRGAHAVR